MPVYVDSNAGGANDGTSWTDAYTSIASTTGVAAGTEIWVASDHSQTNGANWSLNWSNGTVANPVRIISVNKSNDTYQRGALLRSGDGASYYTFAVHGNIFIRGLDLHGARHLNMCSNNQFQQYEDCLLRLLKESSVITFGFGSSYTSHRGRFVDCEFNFGTSSNNHLRFSYARAELIRCTWSTVPTTSWGGQHAGSNQFNLVDFIACDLTNVDNLWDSNGSGVGRVRFSKCKLPSSYVIDEAPSYGVDVIVEASEDGTISVPPPLFVGGKNLYGSTALSLSRYRDGGADDGFQANEFSVEMVSTSSALEIYRPLEFDLSQYVAPAALSPSGATARGIFTSTRCAPLATPAALTTDSGSTWNGSGVGTKQQISITLTNGATLTWHIASGGTLNDDDFWLEVVEPDQVGGLLEARAFLAKPSTTIYVDPVPTIT